MNIRSFFEFNENMRELYLKDIIGDSIDPFYRNSEFIITNKGVGAINNPDYSYDEIKNFYIEELTKYKEERGKYISRVFQIFEHGNISGKMDIEIIYYNDSPILAILFEIDSNIKGDILTITDYNGIEDSVNLSILRNKK